MDYSGRGIPDQRQDPPCKTEEEYYRGLELEKWEKDLNQINLIAYEYDGAFISSNLQKRFDSTMTQLRQMVEDEIRELS